MENSTKSQLGIVLLRSSFIREDAEFVTEVLDEIDQKQEANLMRHKEYFLNKEDKAELIEKIAGAQTELSGRINGTRTDLTGAISEVQIELTGQITRTRTGLTETIGEVRSDLIDRIDKTRSDLTEMIGSVRKSIYITGLLQFLAIVGAVLAIIRFVAR